MANLLSTSISGTATTSDSVVIGGTFANNPYNSVSSTRLLFGGGSEPNNYFIGTNLDNYGGNYTKLDLRWHTGIRMGAQPSYGGIRFFNSETLGSRIMSIGETDANVRIDNNLWIGGAGGWITDLLGAKQEASTAITTGNIASQSVNFANSSTSAAYLNYTGVGATQINANTFGYGRASNYYGTGQIINSPEGAYASLYNFGGSDESALSLQMFASVNHNNTASTRNLWFRVGNNLGFQNDWKEVIHSGSIASQSVSYATSSGNSVSTDQTNFAELFIEDAPVATKEFVTSQGYLTSLPSHTHDDRYYTESEVDNLLSGKLSSDSDSEQAVGGNTFRFNLGGNRANIDPRWNESGYDADLGVFHMYATTSAGATWGRTGIALYNGSAYQYLTTRGSTTGIFLNNQEIIHSGNIGSQSVSYADESGYSASTGTTNNIEGRQFRNTGSNAATNADTIDSNGITYYNAGVSNFSGNATDGALYSQVYNNSWQHQIAGDYRSGMIAVRGRNNGTWTSWRTIIDSSTIGSQSVNYATSAGNADTVDSLHASSFVRNDATGQYLRAYYQYGSYLTTERPIDLRNQMGGSGMRVDFMNGGGGGNWNHVITFSGYDAYNMYQLGGYYDGGSSTNLYVRSEANHGTVSWTAWRRLLNEVADPYAVNMNQYVRTTDGPTFAEVYSNGWFRNYGQQGIYNQSYGNHFYSQGSGAWSITGAGGAIELQMRSNHNSTLRGYVYADTSNNIGFLSEDGNWVLRTWNRAVEAYGSMRAPIFYDSSDTNYYLDPAGTSRLGGLMLEANLETGRATYGADKANLVLLASSTYGRAAIDFRSGVNYPSDGAQIYYETATNLSSGETSRLVIRTENDADDSILIRGGFIELNSTTVDGGSSSPGVRTQYNGNNRLLTYSDHTAETSSFNAPQFLVNNHSDNTRGYRIHNTSGSSVSAMFTNSSNALVIGAGAFAQVNLNKKVFVNGVALGVNVAPSATAGRIDASNDIVAYSSSDERLKHNIAPIENALDKVKSLTGVEFDWKPEHKHAHGYEGHDTGIIAQQVQAVMPSAVRTNETGFLAVRYEKLIGLLVEANKELAARVEELEKKLG